MLDEAIRIRGIDAWKVLDMHDEAQLDTHEHNTHLLWTYACISMEEAGEHYNLNIPLEADVKVGNNWSETH